MTNTSNKIICFIHMYTYIPFMPSIPKYIPLILIYGLAYDLHIFFLQWVKDEIHVVTITCNKKNVYIEQ